MNADKPYPCDSCGKSFKLECHLKRHKTSCKQFSDYIACVECKKKLKSKKTLKVHKLSCNPSNVYSCSECDNNFLTFSALTVHKQALHAKTQCDYCDHVCHMTNLKRHIKNKHKGLRPSNSVNKVKTVKTEKVYNCEICARKYYDKSTLNRHVKSHSFRCVTCDKAFKDKKNLDEHILTHKEVSNVMNCEKASKMVSCPDNFEDVAEIPKIKAPFNDEMVDKVLEIKQHTDKVLLIHKNRGQFMKVNDLKKYIESQTKRNLTDNMLKVMISLCPGHYAISMFKANVVIEMETSDKPVTPRTNDMRWSEFKKEIWHIHQKKEKCVDLIAFPEQQKYLYKSAKDLIEEHILKISDDEEEDAMNDENDNHFERLLKKVKKKADKKARRGNRLKGIDFQKNRLPQLAREVNSVYRSDQKSCIKFEVLLSRISSGSDSKRSDLERLIRDSNGWLKMYKDWVKRKPSVDINTVCSHLS